jgi:hypothetical protein
MNRDFQQLRKILDGNDGFMTGSRIGNLRHQRKRPIPDWTRDNRKIKAILLDLFPKLQTDVKQRARAAKWARVIHLYFRLGYTYRQVAEELEITLSASRGLIWSINLVSRGRQANGRKQRGLRRRGRPSKV